MTKIYRASLFGGLLALSLAACAPASPTRDLETQAPGAAPQDVLTTAVLTPRVIADPAQLNGVEMVSLAAMLGQPDLLRKDRPAQVWQYLGPGCVLDIFLYPSGPGLRVMHFDIRARAGQEDAPNASQCVEFFVKRRAEKPSA